MTRSWIYKLPTLDQVIEPYRYPDSFKTLAKYLVLIIRISCLVASRTDSSITSTGIHHSNIRITWWYTSDSVIQGYRGFDLVWPHSLRKTHQGGLSGENTRVAYSKLWVKISEINACDGKGIWRKFDPGL